METSHDRTITVGEWLLTVFLASLPVIGLIMLLVWSFGGGAPQSKANWAKAMLLWMVIAIAMIVGLFILLALVGASLQGA